MFMNPTEKWQIQTNGKTAQENYDEFHRKLTDSILLEREIRRIVRDEILKSADDFGKSAEKGLETALNGLKIEFLGFSK